MYAAHADNKENLKHNLNIINIKLNNLINNYLTNLVELIQKISNTSSIEDYKVLFKEFKTNKYDKYFNELKNIKSELKTNELKNYMALYMEGSKLGIELMYKENYIYRLRSIKVIETNNEIQNLSLEMESLENKISSIKNKIKQLEDNLSKLLNEKVTLR